MARAYSTLMTRVVVTPDMRQRILKAVEQPRKRALGRRVGRYAALAACLALVVGALLTVPLWKKPAQTPPVQTTLEIVQVDTQEALEKTVGFPVEAVMELPFTVEETTYAAYGNQMAQVTYLGMEAQAVLRKSTGTEDNSGDYTVYAQTSTLEVGGTTVTLKGDEAGYCLALWNCGGYAYSLRLSEDAGIQAWTAMLESMACFEK